jgi:hypothetical protein
MTMRAVERFPLQLPISVRWMTASGATEAETRCHDISSRGIYFSLPTAIEHGSKVDIIITLPEGSSQPRVHCQGRVRRTQVIESNHVEVAAQIERYRFLRGSDDANLGFRRSGS